MIRWFLSAVTFWGIACAGLACPQQCLAQDLQYLRLESSAKCGHELTVSQVSEGWIALFDGETLFGWNAESDANWRVEDGCIVVDQGSEPGLLRTLTQFDQFRLHLEYSADESTNSGVFVRTSPKPTDPLVDCIEINVAPENNSYPSGSLVGRTKSSSTIPAALWHAMDITVLRTTVQARIDGVETASLEVDNPLGRGHIGLQFNSGPIKFRNIRLKPHGLNSMFNGSDLDGWILNEQSSGMFGVEDYKIRARGGLGQLESTGQYDDFVLQFKCRNNKPGLNSGLFFRCIPGETLNGYEIQIDNTFVDGDRTKPKNGGTGCIFRRNTARRIIGDDEQWMAITLVAVGPRFSVWVNGHQVTEWKDEREIHENPRNGRRLDAGSIMLQAHDETTDTSFVDLAIGELSPRLRNGKE